MPKVGIVAALPGELKPLVRGWSQNGAVAQGRVCEADCFAVAAGMGAAAATRGVEQLIAAAGQLDALVSYGWAGALVDHLRPPATCIIGAVIDSRTGERYTLEPSTGPTLVTMDHVVARSRKAALAARYGASLVDMEAATVGRLARARGIRFLSLKAVSDGVADDLPDFNAFANARGQLQLPALLRHVMLRPRYWQPLCLLGINSNKAARGLAEALPECLQGAGLIS